MSAELSNEKEGEDKVALDPTTDQVGKTEKRPNSPLAVAQKFETLFTEYDTNGDGLIDFSEWTELIRNSSDVALDHLSENDSRFLFSILSNNTAHIKYPDLVVDLVSAAKENPGMPANAFVNFFLRVTLPHKDSSITAVKEVGVHNLQFQL
ncbi:hypothetical protein RFI_21784 [Reticulomyxa filosa]|uniref:EF-hand domain-containing protein n=1 Tax=Reticulomyxa filosa TaxID=46433 RepID=X6MNZ2_RETFI|nr:hypothetical protein RFI_21784 [Reticulomyxa filosa]|eukprot:ETO15579.1 hypothetical protein RFI_21784 [Reticulomyxa filosa]